MSIFFQKRLDLNFALNCMIKIRAFRENRALKGGYDMENVKKNFGCMRLPMDSLCAQGGGQNSPRRHFLTVRKMKS